MQPKFLLLSALLCVSHLLLSQAQVESPYLKVSKNLELRGLTHIRYQEFQEEGRIDGFDLRRARLDFRGDVAPKIGYRVHLELANGPKILDATFVYKPYEYFNVNVGQSKTPYCYDNLYSPWNLLSISRTQIDNALSGREADLYGNQNGRDIGLWLSGRFSTGVDDAKRPIVEYTLGVYNGSGINVADNNKEKDFGGALRVSPIKDLWLSGRFYSGTGRTVADPLVDTDRKRFGGDITYTYKNFIVEAEYLSGEDENDSIGTLKRDGFYATLAYTPVKDKLQLLVRLDNYDPNTDDATGENAINKYVIAAKWFFSKVTTVQLEYNIVSEEADVDLDNNLFALQFQAAF